MPLSTTETPGLPIGVATDVSEETSPTIINIQLWRIWFVVACFSILALLILLRLVSYQVFRWGEVARAAVPDSVGHVARGVVVDRDGELLAADRFFYQISAEPRHIETDEARMAVAQTLEQLLGIPAAQTLQQLIENANRAHLPIGDLINLDAGNRLLAWKATDAASANPILTDVFVTPAPKRYYPQNGLGGHIIGFVNTESMRRANYGIERYYNRFLRQDGVGLTGKHNASIDSLSPAVRRFMPSVAGKDLVLTMDRTIQWIIEEELRENIDFYSAQSGTIIVMEPQTGAILGMANWPDYNPNQYSETAFTHFTNSAISAQYEPGSIFKVVTMAAALDIGAVEPSTIYTDSGQITIGGRTIYNSNRGAAGEVTATYALGYSLNVVIAEIASQVGAKDFYRYVRRMGFGQASEIDLAGEVPGLVKAPGSLDWSLSDLGTNSFGQGLAVTPIQMISAVAAFANEGMLMRPYIVHARVHNDEVQITQPTVVRQVVKPETAATLTEMMIDVVKTGNKGAIVPDYTVAGKSGTAEIPTEEGYTLDDTIVSFVGFAPAKDPRFVLLIKLDQPDPNISRWASQTAAPVFSRVAARLLSHMNVPPTGGR